MEKFETIAIVLVILGFVVFLYVLMYALMSTSYRVDEEAEQLYIRKFGNNESKEQ